MVSRRPQFDPDALPLGLTPRTVFVTGKGGVGKSTVTAALALAWRDAGARTLIVEIEGHASAAAAISPRTIGYDPVPIGEQISAMRITLLDALKEYARLRVKVKLVADRLVANPIVDQFAQAAPGFRDLLILGKLWALAGEKDERGLPCWDAIIVDSPATGHGLGLLNMAGVIARMFPVGPIATEAKRVDAFTRDPERVGVVLVALPEELPVTETLELRDQLVAQGIDVAATVLNGLLIDRFAPEEIQRVRAALDHDAAADDRRVGELDEPVVHAFETAIWEHTRSSDQAEERARLDAAIGDTPAALLPWMFSSHLDREHIASLAQWLTPAGQDVLLEQLAGATAGPAAAAAVHAANEDSHV
ncbi:MAG: Anion-transporting ATPase [Thermoleophilia bacterium]|nr:Anion-transporting ATPase [Thermoleophilia bacterium]